MSLLEAIILGIIQGATEFLPISSSGHLVLLPYIFDMTEPDLSLIAMVHEGTLLAVLIYFRRDVWEIIKGVLAGLRQGQPMATAESRLGWYIVVGTIPAAMAGLLLEDFFEAVFGTPTAAAFFLLVTAIFLVAGERMLSGRKDIGEMSWFDAIVVGVFQMFALFPGLSRSGSTIAAGLWRGLDRTAAARYSFLLGMPAFFGAGLLSSFDIMAAGDMITRLPVFAVSFVAAAVSGYACIHFLLSWLRQRSLYVFAIYCAAFGTLFLLSTLL